MEDWQAGDGGDRGSGENFCVCTKYLISFTFLLDTLSILDFDEVFSSLLILLLRNMFNWEIWVHLHFFVYFIAQLSDVGQEGGRRPLSEHRRTTA